MRSIIRAIVAAVLIISMVASPPALRAQSDDLIPACGPGKLNNLNAYSVLESYVQNYFSLAEFSGLALNPPCIYQNFNGMDGTDITGPRGVISKAEPAIVSITNVPVIVKFNVEAAGLSGPFDTGMSDCVPPASAGAKFCEVNPNEGPKAMFRLRSSNGTFDGLWKFPTATNNPYFQFKRLGSCPSGLPNIEHPGSGASCTYELRFATDPSGNPVLKTAMQVVIWNYAAGGGTHVTDFGGGNVFTSANGSSPASTSMLFIPGSTTSLTIEASKASVLSGEEVAITGKVIGAIVPSSLPVLALDRSAVGAGNWSSLLESVTDAQGSAIFKINPTTTYDYRIRLSGSSVGAPVVSTSLPIIVTSPNAILIGRINLLTNSINGLLKAPPRSKAAAQKALRANIKSLNSELLKFVNANSATILVASSKIKIKSLAKTANGKIAAALKLNKLTFAADRKAAQKALVALKKGLAL